MRLLYQTTQESKLPFQKFLILDSEELLHVPPASSHDRKFESVFLAPDFSLPGMGRLGNDRVDDFSGFQITDSEVIVEVSVTGAVVLEEHIVIVLVDLCGFYNGHELGDQLLGTTHKGTITTEPVEESVGRIVAELREVGLDLFGEGNVGHGVFSLGWLL